METTTMLDEKFDTNLNSLFRRRIDEVTGTLTEHYEMRDNLDPEGEWVACPSKAFTYLTMVGSASFSIRNVLLNLIGEAREVERAFAERDEWRNKYETSAINHGHDIAVIRNRLVEEAEKRDWCSEFDDIIEDVNRQLNVEMDPRERDFYLTVSFTVSGSASTSVRAASLDEAVEILKDSAEDYIEIDDAVIEAANYGGFEVDDIYQS